jgi:hypothetical protein
MTNPNNAIGTNGAFGGRTSVNAFNDGLSAWNRGVLSGWACVPDSGMTVAIGGDPDTRDVAVAEDDAGNKTSINNISMAPVKVTIPGAPASNTRIDSIVAYVDNPPQGSSTITDNYEACGLIVVSGTASSTPTAPNESTIRSAITSDGATGATAYYVVLANVSVATGTTDITPGEIMAGDVASLSVQGIIGTPNIADGAVTADKIDFTTSTDANGWSEIDCGSFRVYLKHGSTSITVGGGMWKGEVFSSKPVNLDITRIFGGSCCGQADDNAISMNGRINHQNGAIIFSLVNHHYEEINTTARWNAIIVEFIG